MQIYPLYEALDIVAAEPQALLYLSGSDCGVCHAVKPKIQALAEIHSLKALEINLTEQPQAAAAFEVFTIPAVILYARGREYYRQARFIHFAELAEQITRAPSDGADYAEIFK